MWRCQVHSALRSDPDHLYDYVVFLRMFSIPTGLTSYLTVLATVLSVLQARRRASSSWQLPVGHVVLQFAPAESMKSAYGIREAILPEKSTLNPCSSRRFLPCRDGSATNGWRVWFFTKIPCMWTRSNQLMLMITHFQSLDIHQPDKFTYACSWLLNIENADHTVRKVVPCYATVSCCHDFTP